MVFTKQLQRLSSRKGLMVLLVISLLWLVFTGKSTTSPKARLLANDQESVNAMDAYILTSNSLAFNLDTNWQLEGKSIDSGYFNLGSKPFALIQFIFSNPAEALTPTVPTWIFISRNNVFTPVKLLWMQDGALQERMFRPLDSIGKTLKAELPIIADGNRVYIGLMGKYMRGELSLVTERGLVDKIKQSALINGAYYGFTGLVIFVSLLLALTLRQQIYPSYALFVTVTSLWLAAGEGWLTAKTWSGFSLPFFTANALGLVFFIALAAFSKHYLQLHALDRRLYRGMSWLQLCLIAIWLGYSLFFNKVPEGLYQFGYGLALLIGMAVLVLAICGALIAVKRKRQQAKFYLGALSLFFLFALVSVLVLSNTINLPLNWHWLQLASVIEIMLLTTGLVFLIQQKYKEQEALDREFEKMATELDVTQQDLDSLKTRMNESLLPPSLTPEIAKVIAHKSDTLFIKGSGNYAELCFFKNNRLQETLIECNLQTIENALSGGHLLRVHKSYLVNLEQGFELIRRNSADFDLVYQEHRVPVGRSYLKIVRQALS